MPRLALASVLLCALLTAIGCEKSVTINHPKSGSYAKPVTPLNVTFNKDYKPGTFKATLEGADITHLFQPPAVASGTSTAVAPYMDYKTSPHVLHVEGDFATTKPSIDTRQRYDESQFTPPTVFIVRADSATNNNLSMAERQTVRASAVISSPFSESVTVTITPDENQAVSLNDQPVGQSITVVIPTNDRRADFSVRGVRTGVTFVLRPRAAGYASRGASGTVSAP